MISTPPYVMGIDVGTSGVKTGIFDLCGRSAAIIEEKYELSTPKPAWAEQSPDDWWASVCKSCRELLSVTGISPEEILGIGLDSTCCTVVATDKNLNPLRPAIMWMDMRATEQAKAISRSRHAVLKYNGYGSVSPEFFPCKALWMKENERDVYDKTEWFVESTEWLIYKLTRELAMSINTVTMRWYYDNRNSGWNDDFYVSVGLDDIFEKVPERVLPIGDTVGRLCEDAATQTGLKAGIPVAVGISDAHAAVIGLNVTKAGQTALITGSSHLLEGLMKKEMHGSGFFGTYPDVIIDGLHLIENGQTSTGAVLNWFIRSLGTSFQKEAEKEGIGIYDYYERKAKKLPIGSEGLILLDWFQGNRTPYTDGDVRGMIYGLSLSHEPAHIFRAIMESVCYGTNANLNEFRKNGYSPDAIHICGGAANSDLWLSIHADVCGLPIFVPREKQAASLGSAILGAISGGAYETIQKAAEKMVHIAEKIEPNPDNSEAYRFYFEKYNEAYLLMHEWMHSVTRHK